MTRGWVLTVPGGAQPCPRHLGDRGQGWRGCRCGSGLEVSPVHSSRGEPSALAGCCPAIGAQLVWGKDRTQVRLHPAGLLPWEPPACMSELPWGASIQSSGQSRGDTGKRTAACPSAAQASANTWCKRLPWARTEVRAEAGLEHGAALPGEQPPRRALLLASSHSAFWGPRPHKAVPATSGSHQHLRE